jgi:hypothetical protein
VPLLRVVLDHASLHLSGDHYQRGAAENGGNACTQKISMGKENAHSKISELR